MDSQTNLKNPGELTAEGFAQMKAHDYEQALQLFFQAAEIYDKNNDFKNKSIQLQAISEIYRLTGKVDDAVKTCDDLLDLYRQIEEYEQMFRVLNNMGLLEIGRKNYDRALIRFKSALELAEKLDNKKYAAIQSGNIGSTFRDMNQSGQAIKFYEKALGFYEESGHREGLADQYTNIAYIHVTERRFTEALEFYQKALPVYEEIEKEDKAQFTRQNIERLEAAISQ